MHLIPNHAVYKSFNYERHRLSAQISGKMEASSLFLEVHGEHNFHVIRPLTSTTNDGGRPQEDNVQQQMKLL